MKFYNKLCAPAKLYFGVEILTSLYAVFKGIAFLAILIKLFFAFIWAYLLNMLCKNGYKSVAWFIVLLPYIVILLLVTRIIRISRQQQQMLVNEDQMKMVNDMYN